MYHTILSLENRIIEQALKSGAEYCDLRYELREGTSLEMKNNELREAVPGKSEGAVLRVLLNGSWGIFSFNDEEGLRRAPETALRLARASGKGESGLAPVPAVKDKVIWKPEINPEDISIEEKFGLVKSVNSEVMKKEGVVGITSNYSDSRIRKRIVTSEGTEVEFEFCRAYIQSTITAKKKGRLLGYRTRVGSTGGYEIFRNEDPVEKAVKGAEAALTILGAKESPSGRMTVVADNDLTGVFAHEAVGHTTEADLVTAGESVLQGKLGEQIASKIVTLVDDPTIKGGFGSFPYDDEGVKGQRKVLIEKGVLRDYILDRETAHILGLRPNGGARAESYGVRPLVRMSNTMILGGDMSFEELIEDIDYGVYAKGTRGGQVDTVKGSFQFSAQQAFLIEKGEVTIPLRDVSLSGMTLETLKNIDALGRDERLGDPGFCGKGQLVPVGDGGPPIRIRNAVVGGGA